MGKKRSTAFEWVPTYMAPEEAEGMLHALSIPQTEENYLRTLLALVFNADVLSAAQREKICRIIIDPPSRRRGRKPYEKRHMELVELLSPGLLQIPGGEWAGLRPSEAIPLVAKRWNLEADPKEGSGRSTYEKARKAVRESRSPKYDADGKGLAYFDMEGRFHAEGYERPSHPAGDESQEIGIKSSRSRRRKI